MTQTFKEVVDEVLAETLSPGWIAYAVRLAVREVGNEEVRALVDRGQFRKDIVAVLEPKDD